MERHPLLDTDHLWGIGGSVDWAYKVFCRGYHVLYMDKCTDYPSTFYEEAAYPGPSNLEVRRALGTIKSFADRLDLARTRPCTDRASSGYCLSDGRQWLVYAPEGQVAVNADEGIYVATFFDPVEGAVLREERVQGDRFLWLQVPGAKPVVVHLTPS
ncbi:MAG TPA: hypothetical protein VGJ84_03560 [Polyangiaceae bacterium]|jgi:hypothetical protein